MIHYSSYPDLYKVMEMFSEMSQEDKKFLFFDNQHFFTKLTKLHYRIIKGQSLMLINDDGKTIGFVTIDLENDEQLFITELFIADKFRKGSLPILLEMFAELKKYLRPIHFITHLENLRMQKLARFVNAQVVRNKDVRVEYVIHI